MVKWGSEFRTLFSVFVGLSVAGPVQLAARGYQTPRRPLGPPPCACLCPLSSASSSPVLPLIRHRIFILRIAH